MRVGAEDRRQIATTINGREYHARGGYFDFGDNARDAKAHMQSGNLPAPALSGATSRKLGFRCPACGHGSFFATCKCGGACERED